MKVEIWSDFVCPFCYIGKKKFEAALAQFAHKEHIVTEFRSFELNPKADSSARIRTYDMLSQKYGMTVEQAKASSDNLVQQAAAVGLHFKFDDAMELNTFDTHRLAQYGESQGRGAETAERLFRAYFTDNEDISDKARLVELAVEAGLEEAAVRAVLESDQFADVVRGQEEEGSRLGIRGVPFFVIDRKYAVSGAQSPAVFLDTLNKAWEAKYPTLVQVSDDQSGASCTDGYCAPGTDKS
ncbi:DsbA family oxidoreductase [Paenibacillus sp. 1011MAR3C5]|uniref:DsbA family oxidoreductase n=1 Tax=Paenibacillus sp. 1011MAR3C5 TaxID=1675787 RepID=UPI000E6D06C5|nr:DsbA family oxidoreductase [Paenibacillus sp. 1011MAR3C5]RJE90218.1 DsbA family oxidoreductase [Paenibacillus sp. 1011MAR3C5]